MGVVDQVMQMRNQNMSDDEIESTLKKQNPKMSPREIQKAVEHAGIKTAVGNTAGDDENYDQPPSPGDSPFGNQDTYTPQPGSYGGNQQQYSQQDYNNQNQGNYNYPQQQDYQQNYDQGQGGYDQGQGDYAEGQGYDQGYDQGAYSPGYGQPQESSDTMVEIAEQVFEEKSKEMIKKLDSIEEFRALSQAKLDNLSERLKKIESVIDRLQAAILERIGTYGRDIGSIKKEMSMMQDTFSKAMEPHARRTESKTEKSPKK